MTTECTTERLEFGGLRRQRVVGRFDGGELGSDGGGLLLRHAALPSSHLHDAPVFVLRANHGFALAQVVCQRLFHVHVLAALAGVDGHRDMPVVGRNQ